MTRILTASAWSALLVLALGACGSDQAESTASTAADPAASSAEPGSNPDSRTPTPSPTPSTEPSASPPTGPACAKVWNPDGRIPGRYQGCLQDGEWVKAHRTQCASGQVLVTFGDRYYGAEGYPVNDVGSPLRASSMYRSAVTSCG